MTDFDPCPGCIHTVKGKCELERKGIFLDLDNVFVAGCNDWSDGSEEEEREEVPPEYKDDYVTEQKLDEMRDRGEI